MKLIFKIALGLGVSSSLYGGPFSTNAPANWKQIRSLYDEPSSRLNLSNNTPDQIRQELLNPETIKTISDWKNVSPADLQGVRILIEPGDELISLYQISGGERTFSRMAEGLGTYATERMAGHTKDFVLSALKERSRHEPTGDPDLKLFLNARPLVLSSSVQKVASGTVTNKAGTIKSILETSRNVNGRVETVTVTNRVRSDEVCRWIQYRVVDGEIAWNYTTRFKSDGQVEDVSDTREDAKDYDPKFHDVISKVEKQVQADVKKAGLEGRLGSVHTYWRLKREKLKALGIDWRSPAELNPDTNFD
jgi:hypothetical protein